MIAISIGILITVIGCLFYALTGICWSFSREIADRFCSFIIAELIIEFIAFLVWLVVNYG